MKNIFPIAIVAGLALGACAPSDFKDGEELMTTELAVHADSSADGGPYRGELALCDWSNDALTARNAYHFWTFETGGCDDMLIDLASRAGDDTYLMLYRQIGASWYRIDLDDDCTSGTLNSCIERSLSAGRYLVAATTYEYMRWGQPTAAEYGLRVVCRDPGVCSEPEQACGSRGLEPCPLGQYCDWEQSAMCGAADVPGVCRDMPDFCPEIHDPVCGCDGRTFSSDCHAAQHGISVASEGPCAPVGGQEGDACGGLRGLSCADGLFCNYAPGQYCGAADATGVCASRPDACITLYDPVCGCDDNTYSNECFAAQAGVGVSHTGECSTPDDGNEVGEICGGIAGFRCRTGLWCDYSANDFCGADLAGTCKEEVEILCTREYAPVCGCDGRTYNNDCERRAAGVALDHEGACR